MAQKRDADTLLAERLRLKRSERGWTLRELAKRAGIDSISNLADYEQGRKIPRPERARKLAKALGDQDHGDLYAAWAAAGKRSTNAERQELDELLKQSHVQKEFALPGEVTLLSRTTGAIESTGTMTMIPVLVAGQDPDAVPGPKVMDRLMIKRDRLAKVHELDRPFAYELSPKVVERLTTPPHPKNGFAIINRTYSDKLIPEEVYAVRVGRSVVLSHIWWNKRILIAFPGPGSDNLVSLTAKTTKELREHVVGIVDVLIPELR